MSQEHKTLPKKSRRVRGASRPVLVTQKTQPEDTQTVATQTTTPIQEELETVAAVPAASPSAPQRSLRLPNFFSRVDKSEQEDSTQNADVVQARMARARKNSAPGEKVKTTTPQDAEEEKKAPAQPAARATTSSKRPAGMFKPRHIAGMAIYLLAAQFILPYERLFAINMGIEKQIANFPFFGIQASITTSFLLNILTLILLLYLLVRFDFLPNGKQMAQAQQTKTGGAGNNSGTPSEKTPPKVIREGVRGEDDDLYNAYRMNQRREKKR